MDKIFIACEILKLSKSQFQDFTRTTRAARITFLSLVNILIGVLRSFLRPPFLFFLIDKKCRLRRSTHAISVLHCTVVFFFFFTFRLRFVFLRKPVFNQKTGGKSVNYRLILRSAVSFLTLIKAICKV